MSDMPTCIGLSDVREELAKGNRVLLLVRHAERPHIDHEDPTFGGNLPITEDGKAMSLAFGEKLKGASDDVQFRASPLRRTVMTAQEIARGMGLEGAEIPLDDAIGNGSAFITDLRVVWELFRDCHFFAHMTEYMKNGSLAGFAPNKEAGERYERYVLSKFHCGLGIFTTHDVFIAAYLFAKGVKRDWGETCWPGFLSAAVIIIEPNGCKRYAYLDAPRA